MSCRYGGRIFEDGGRRCRRHRTEADRALIAELDARGRKIGVPRAESGLEDELAWLYGPRTYIEMRRAMVEWAETHELRYADRTHACNSWVSGNRCAGVGRCSGLSLAILRHLDHSSCWFGPAGLRLIVAQPYQLTADDAPALRAVAETEGLHLVVQPPGVSWYGNGTLSVLIAGFPAATGVAA